MSRPIVRLDIAKQPSRWRRAATWCWSKMDAPAPYRSIPCQPALPRALLTAIAGIAVALLIAAWVIWGHW